MKYLFFDTETCGLPRDYKAPLDDFENWPRMVELSCATSIYRQARWVEDSLGGFFDELVSRGMKLELRMPLIA